MSRRRPGVGPISLVGCCKLSGHGLRSPTGDDTLDTDMGASAAVGPAPGYACWQAENGRAMLRRLLHEFWTTAPCETKLPPVEPEEGQG
jgi:hypothetical protein